MNRRKLNTFPWLLGLTVLLLVACVVGATGTSFARYKLDFDKSIYFSPEALGEFFLGKMVSTDGVSSFAAEDPDGWKMVDGQLQLQFAVANGISEETAAANDQNFRISLIGSPGIWDGEKTVTIKLLVPSGTVAGQTQELTATATRIGKDAPLYPVFGEGWVFTFPEQDGEEYSWLLEGGKLSVAEITLVADGTAFADPSLLQLQITGY